MKRQYKDHALDADARDAIKRFVRIMLRRGFSATVIQDAVEQACQTLPKRTAPLPADAGCELPEAGHLLTLWRLEPAYVDQKGEPKALRRRGRAPSFEALARSYRTDWDTEEVLRFLIRGRAVRCKGACYVPTRRGLLMLGFDGPAIIRSVRSIARLMRTNEHNLITQDASQGWFDRETENFNFPVRKLSEFAALLNREGMIFLKRLDAYLRDCELARTADEPTVRLGVGLYRYQQENKK